MRSVVFLSQKGGSGKTTLAVHIAVVAEESGEKVALLDTDLQASAGAWGDVRAKDTPPIARASPSETPRVIEAAHNDSGSSALVTGSSGFREGESAPVSLRVVAGTSRSARCPKRRRAGSHPGIHDERPIDPRSHGTGPSSACPPT